MKRPKPTEELKERRLQILSLNYGKRSLKYLLEEQKLRECGLLGENESIDDGHKYFDWQDVPVPLNYKSPLDTTPVLGSPVQAPERTQSEHEGILAHMLSMCSPTLLETIPNKFVSFPRHTDYNFFVRANPDYIVHKYNSDLKRWQIKFSSEEHMEEYIYQYDTNELIDLSYIGLRIDDLPLATPLVEPEPTLPS